MSALDLMICLKFAANDERLLKTSIEEIRKENVAMQKLFSPSLRRRLSLLPQAESSKVLFN